MPYPALPTSRGQEQQSSMETTTVSSSSSFLATRGQRQRNPPEHHRLPKLRSITMPGDSIVAACFGRRWRRECKFATHKLASYTSAHREIIPAVEHRRGGRLNNRAENSHQPTRERERRMRRFKSIKHAQRFLSTHGQVSNHFRCGRHLMRACHYWNKMAKQFETWRMVCGLDQPAIVDHRLTCA